MNIPVFLNTTHRDGSARVRAPCELRPRGSQAIPGGHELPLLGLTMAATVGQRLSGSAVVQLGVRGAERWRAGGVARAGGGVSAAHARAARVPAVRCTVFVSAGSGI